MTGVVLLGCISTAAVSATDLSGSWEIQSMGADRNVVIQQKGSKVVAHRLMWPEFEGKKYKLEHLYRGRLSGRGIRGQLLVREEELPAFEVLRSFSGSVQRDGTIILDGLPLKRSGKGVRLKKPPKVKPGERTRLPPGFSQKSPPRPVQERPAPVRPASPETGTVAEGGLFASIMGQPGMHEQGLFGLAGDVGFVKADSPSPLQGAEAALAAGRHRKALAAFKSALRRHPKHRAAAEYGVGRCYLLLGKKVKAKRHLRRALRLDPTNAKVVADYKQAS